MRRASEPVDSGPTTALRSARSVTFNNNEVSRTTEPPRGGRYRPSDTVRVDPAALLKDFDSKLQSIHEVLTKYRSERTTQGAKGGPAAAAGGGGAGLSGAGSSGDHSHAQHHHNHNHDRPMSGTSSAPNSARRWRSSHQQQQQQHEPVDPGAIMDEEVFVRHVLATPRRVQSAVPGASRTLSARIEYYRSHRDKAQEKADKAREEQLAAQREMINGAAAGAAAPSINFIEANRRSIVPYALPPSIQMTIDTLRDHGLSSFAAATRRRGCSMASTGSGSGSTHELGRSVRPWSAARSSVGPYSSPAMSPGAAPATASNGGLYNSRTVGTAAGAAAGGGHGWVQPVSETEWERGRKSSVAAAVAGPGAPRHSSVSWDGTPDGDGGADAAGGSPSAATATAGARPSRANSVFLTSVDIPSLSNPAVTSSPAGTPASGASRDTSPSNCRSPGGGGGGGATAAGSGAAAARQARPSTAASALSTYGTYTYSIDGAVQPRASANSTVGAGSGTGPGPGGGGGPPIAGSVSGSYEGGLFYGSAASAVGVNTRRLRLALSARPASGGSPTRRMEFLAEQAARRAERAIYAAVVRERAAALDAERRRSIVAAQEQRAAQRREEEARQAAARALAERQERQRQWTAIVGLCSKLSFLAERIHEDRRVRKLRALRKEAAVKIATWYKGILLRRRQKELVQLIQRLRGLIRPYLARQRVLVRQRCAERLVSFLQYTQTSNMAVVGVRRLKAEVEVLQTAWRNALLVRSMQRHILYNQLTRLEKEVVTANKRTERTFAGQLFRLGKSVNIQEPDGFSGFPSTPAAAAGRSFRSIGNSSMRQHQHQHQQQLLQQQQTMMQPQPGYTTYDSMAIISGNAADTSGGAATAAPTTRSTTNARQYDKLRQPHRGVLLLEAGGDEEDEVLRGHLEAVPREVREQVVDAFLRDARREHRKLLEQYSNEKVLYHARKPIEEMRQKMLRDAGLTVEPDVKPPVMPHMRLVYPRAKLRELLRRAVEINTARLAAAEERRQQEAAEAGVAGAGGGSNGRSMHWMDRHGGGVLWADQAVGSGGAADKPHTAGGGPGFSALSRGSASRRSASRISLKGTSHRAMRPLPS